MKARKPKNIALRPALVIEADIFPTATVGPTLSQLLEQRREGAIKHGDLAGFLAIVASNYEMLGQVPPECRSARNVPIPIEVITMIGEVLASKVGWAAMYNATRVAAVRERNVELQVQAEDVWREHPKFSKTAVAKIIAPERWNDVRRKITKP
jgi:hypothetical protein